MMAKLAYKPLAAFASVLGGVLAAAAFKRAWTLVTSDAEAPQATERNRDWKKILAAAALQGALFGLVKAAIDRASAKGFERATGTWPGD